MTKKIICIALSLYGTLLPGVGSEDSLKDAFLKTNLFQSPESFKGKEKESEEMRGRRFPIDEEKFVKKLVKVEEITKQNNPLLKERFDELMNAFLNTNACNEWKQVRPLYKQLTSFNKKKLIAPRGFLLLSYFAALRGDNEEVIKYAMEAAKSGDIDTIDSLFDVLGNLADNEEKKKIIHCLEARKNNNTLEGFYAWTSAAASKKEASVRAKMVKELETTTCSQVVDLLFERVFINDEISHKKSNLIVLDTFAKERGDIIKQNIEKFNSLSEKQQTLVLHKIRGSLLENNSSYAKLFTFSLLSQNDQNKIKEAISYLANLSEEDRKTILSRLKEEASSKEIQLLRNTWNDLQKLLSSKKLAIIDEQRKLEYEGLPFYKFAVVRSKHFALDHWAPIAFGSLTIAALGVPGIGIALSYYVFRPIK